MTPLPRALVPLLVLVLSALLVACRGRRGEALDPAAMPDDVRADYAVFANRCSRCHGLARPLDVGITSDEHWSNYVERMRRQPGSGISHQDAAAVLRFLRYYSEDLRKKRADK